MAKVGVVTGSQKMFHIAQMVDKVSDTSLPVTITGESGTGKELIARAIHEGSSSSRTGHFVALNCGAVADGLWESELFGHERGAFTGANREKPGLFEVARDGTLFLDEIGDLPLDTQVKLLRVLQQGEFRRVGGHKLLRTNARVVCATHRSLEKMVREGTFREDLWYRLNVIELQLPPLRDRPEDIPLLVQHFSETLRSWAHSEPDYTRTKTPPESPLAWKYTGARKRNSTRHRPLRRTHRSGAPLQKISKYCVISSGYDNYTR